MLEYNSDAKSLQWPSPVAKEIFFGDHVADYLDLGSPYFRFVGQDRCLFWICNECSSNTSPQDGCDWPPIFQKADSLESQILQFLQKKVLEDTPTDQSGSRSVFSCVSDSKLAGRWGVIIDLRFFHRCIRKRNYCSSAILEPGDFRATLDLKDVYLHPSFPALQKVPKKCN